MWIITPLGFFSIVQKPTDLSADTLTVRARVRSDLDALRAAVLPGLGKITESKSTDYRFRATAPRSMVEAAMVKLTQQLDYSNFKNQVAKVQGSKRANLYHDVWDVLMRMQGDASYETAPKSVSPASAFGVPKANAYGGVLFDTHGRTLLREPAGHYGGYVWTFAKGKPSAGESPEQAALREVFEETGYTCRVIGALQGTFKGTTSSTSAFFLMEPVGAQSEFSSETSQTRWVDFEEAQTLIRRTQIESGVMRDLAILRAAHAAMARLGKPSAGNI
jgi:8-oxo-dGTP pyrophosphatase MutT (NUDIX family)